MTSTENQQHTSRSTNGSGQPANGAAAPVLVAHEIEMQLLGALMADNRMYHRVSDIVRPDQFADDRHGVIYDAISVLIDRDEQADPVSLSEALRADGRLEALGGTHYLAQLFAYTVGPLEAPSYATIIRDRWLRRHGVALLTDFQEQLCDTSYTAPSADHHFSNIASELDALVGQTGAAGGPVSIAEACQTAVEMADAAHKGDETVLGCQTGLAPIDNKLRGLRPSQLIILAGRPSMGKTALAADIALNVARDGRRVLFFSLEMSAEELMTREIAKLTGFSAHDIMSGQVEDFGPIVRAQTELGALPLYIDDRPALTIQEMQASARRRNAQLVVVDYLQKSAGAAPGERYYNDVSRVTAISSGLKDMAKRLGIPVLALSQLSRAVEQREDKRPFMSDLRESGAVEQEADVILFLFREEYYLRRDKPIKHGKESQDKYDERYNQWLIDSNKCAGKAELIIAKQRSGPIGDVTLKFEEKLTRFSALGADPNQGALL